MPRQKPAKPARKGAPKRPRVVDKPSDQRQKPPPDHHDTLAGSGMEQEPTR